MPAHTTDLPAALSPGPQHLQALQRANTVRLARAELKRRIADGELSASEVILVSPYEAASMAIGDVLMSQRRWGGTRTRKFLAMFRIAETKTVGSLTERQRHALAAELDAYLAIESHEGRRRPPRLREELEAAGRLCIDLDRDARKAAQRRDQLVIEATQHGLSRRAVAELASLSVARVQQIVAAHLEAEPVP